MTTRLVQFLREYRARKGYRKVDRIFTYLLAQWHAGQISYEVSEQSTGILVDCARLAKKEFRP